MKIYRVQDKDGRGPWKPGFSIQWVENPNDPERMKKLPAFYMEFGFGFMKKHIEGMPWGSGCTSLEQLQKWFTPLEYSRLIGFGYRAVEMEAGRILEQSELQCVFERSKPLNQEVNEVDLYPAVTGKPKT